MTAQQSRNPRPGKRLLLISLAAAALAAASAGTTLTAGRASARAGVRPFPAALVGTWTRRITPADDARFAIQGSDYACLNTLTVTSAGKITLATTGCKIAATNGTAEGSIVPGAPGLVKIDFGLFPSASLVAWSVSGRALKLRALRAPDVGERELWSGTWTRK